MIYAENTVTDGILPSMSQRLQQVENAIGREKLNALMNEMFVQTELAANKISDAVNTNDFTTALKISHNLKGTIGQIGLYDVLSIVRDAENKMKHHEEFHINDYLPTLLITIRDIPNLVRVHLKQNQPLEENGK